MPFTAFYERMFKTMFWDYEWCQMIQTSVAWKFKKKLKSVFYALKTHRNLNIYWKVSNPQENHPIIIHWLWVFGFCTHSVIFYGSLQIPFQSLWTPVKSPACLALGKKKASHDMYTKMIQVKIIPVIQVYKKSFETVLLHFIDLNLHFLRYINSSIRIFYI